MIFWSDSTYNLINRVIDSSSKQFLGGFDDIVLYFTLITNFFWGTWSIVQAKASTIDFDYLGYALLRYDAYFEQKKLFFDESKFEL